ncbi:hypothetical protein D3C86_1425990 [compost metagenome]
MHRHARGDLVQFLELERPEEFVEVEIAVVTLGGAGVGAEEKQLGTVGQHDWIASQLDADHLPGKRQDVTSKQVGLILRGRQKNLIAPSVQGIDKRLASEVVSGADLPALEDDASALVAGPVPIFLIVETAVDKRFAQQLDLVFIDLVFYGLLLRLGIAFGQVRVEVSFSTATLKTLDSRLPLQLPVQQIDLLEVAAAFPILEDQLHQSRFQCPADTFDVVRPIPLIASLPAV